MANALELPGHPEKEVFPSAPSMFPPNSNYPDSTSSSSVPPPYPNPLQYQPAIGMPYSQQYPTQAPVNMGYPPQYAPPPGGQPYYPQPGMANPGDVQQQQTAIVGYQPSGVRPVCAASQSDVSFTGAIALSCITFWCCGWLCGGIAFILAMVGQSSADAGDNAGALRLRNASYGVSIAGIVIGIIIIGVVVGVATSAPKTSTKCYYSSYYGYSCSTY